MRKLFAKEWLFFLSLILAVASSLLLRRLPRISRDEIEVLFVLATFFVTIKGLERSGFLQAVALWLERGNFVALKLLLGTFVISTFVTNDVALVTMVPLTLLLNVERKELLVILEAIAANGAALFPFASPQNLYIYWHYQVPFMKFVAVIAPFVTVTLFLVLFFAMLFRFDIVPRNEPIHFHRRRALAHLALFLLVVLTILKVLPLFIAFVVFFYALLIDQEALEIDYFLLATFLLFFAIADDFSYFFNHQLQAPKHVFLLSVALSQVMSNVPATLVMANFTSDWQALLWGVNVGGFGVLWGSLASLIAYRFYTKKFGGGWVFLAKFTALNFTALLVTALCYFLSSF
jgi:Na+/H+ antiporter NhaD/arsenite permease-like protein